jgi:hypothetical protein
VVMYTVELLIGGFIIHACTRDGRKHYRLADGRYFDGCRMLSSIHIYIYICICMYDATNEQIMLTDNCRYA